jgi:hypothetical protein
MREIFTSGSVGGLVWQQLILPGHLAVCSHGQKYDLGHGFVAMPARPEGARTHQPRAEAMRALPSPWVGKWLETKPCKGEITAVSPLQGFGRFGTCTQGGATRLSPLRSALG